MVLASLVHYGDRLRGGIDIVGISNFVTFLNNTSGYRRDLRRAEYGDERDPAMRTFLQRISPLNRAETIRKPLLVVQGLNDPRVPASESAQLVARVRGGGGEVWYLAARTRGMAFAKSQPRLLSEDRGDFSGNAQRIGVISSASDEATWRGPVAAQSNRRQAP